MDYKGVIVRFGLIILILNTLFSCRKNNVSDKPIIDNIKINGIYNSDYYYLNPGNSIRFSFSFNELSNTEVAGGVRIIIIGSGIGGGENVLKEKFIVQKWEEQEDGSTSIAIKSDFNSDEVNNFGMVNCIGTINTDGTFTFNVGSYLTHITGTANYSGNYLDTFESEYENYKGAYKIEFSESDSLYPNYCFPPNYCNSFVNELYITDVLTDSIGGIDVVGYYVGYTPIYGNDTIQITPGSDIFGDSFYFGKYGWTFSIRGEHWKIGGETEGNYRLKFYDECVERHVLKGALFISTLD